MSKIKKIKQTVKNNISSKDSQTGAKEKAKFARQAPNKQATPDRSITLSNSHLKKEYGGRMLVSWFLFVLLFFSLYLLSKLALPFLNTIILACIFAAITYPITRFFLRLTKDKNLVSAMLTILFLVVMVAIPLSFFISQLVPQAASSINELVQWLSGTHLDTFIQEHLGPTVDWFNGEFPDINISLGQIRASILKFASQTGQMLLGWGTNLIGDTLNFALSLLLMLLIMFFLLKEGPSMLTSLKHLVPMREDQKDHILTDLARMSKAVLVGGLSVAALQGIIGGIGLAIVGIQPLFWGTLMIFAALVPVFGTGLIWIPAVGYLLIVGDWKSAIFLSVWCGVLVSSIDSFIRPILMRGSSNISILFLFMSVFGGIQAFGMLGILYGPLILSFALVMLNIYAEEYRETLYYDGREKLNSKNIPASDNAE